MFLPRLGPKAMLLVYERRPSSSTTGWTDRLAGRVKDCQVNLSRIRLT